MKILQLTTHLNIGGIGNYIVLLSKTLKAKGVSCVVASSGGDLEPELERYGVGHRRLTIKTKSELSPKVLIATLQLVRILRDEQIDIIHAHTRVSQVVASLASRMTGIPYITTCHGYFKKRARKIFDTWGVKVVAISDAVRAHLRDDLEVAPDRIEVIYSGVELAKFSHVYSPDEISRLKRSLGLGEGPVVGTIGRLSPVKGQRFFLESMKGVIAKRPDAHALIVGNGPEETALKILAEKIGLGRSLVFVESNVDTHKFLSIMDVFVFPSIKEGLGIALLEALAAKRACVASEVGGISDIVTDGESGLLVGVGDVNGISASILRLLNDEPLRMRLGDEGRKVVARDFTLDVMADKFVQLYKRIKA